MSCASPLPQLSPPLHMHTVNLVSPCRSDVDPLHLIHSPLSFSFSSASPHNLHLLSSFPVSASRPALADISLHRHKNSPLRSPLPSNRAAITTNVQYLSSPSVDFKEHSEKAGKTQAEDEENGGPTVAALSPSPLKRKRPTKLAIPEFARLASFGRAEEYGFSEQESEFHSREACMFAVSSKRGRKGHMEDAHTAITSFQGKPNQAFFGVFDGHGGKIAAESAAESLSRHIDVAIRSRLGEVESLENAMQAGYLATDAEFLAKGTSGGACSISALLKDGQLVIANAGDCKAVLCRDGKAEALSTLHRVSNVQERQRVESLGGYVDCFNGTWRLQGTLAVTRALGDISYKQWVSAEPEVRKVELMPDCEFLILASDGLWDKVSDQEAIDCAREELLRDSMEKYEEASDSRHHLCSSPCSTCTKKESGGTISGKMKSCNKLIQKAYSRGNLDDITVMVILLKGFAMLR